MFALDTNILVYTHNRGASQHESAKQFMQKVMNDYDENGELSVCIPAQVLLEFINVITWSRLESPLSLPDAKEIVQDYLDTGVTILHPKPTHLTTVLSLIGTAKSRKKIFDIALVATLKDHGVSGLYTANTADFAEFTFLDVQNPLK
ncbi:MAG: PIN domain-containing protein [Anaerolineales bacterium]|nr:PIN domain-containing protein [Anaerolineales bacterium]